MKPIFRNAMFGFHKEDVFNFISKQSKQYEQKISDITSEKEKLEDELEREREATEEKLSKMEADRKALSDAKAVLDEIKLVISRALEDGTSFENTINACGENASNMRNNIVVLKEQVLKSEAFREKALRFDQLSSALSGIFGTEAKSEEQVDVSSGYQEKLTDYDMDSFNELRAGFDKLSFHLNKLSELSGKLDD